MSRRVVFVDDEAYDITDFVEKHPGGARALAGFFDDVSITFHTYHKDPARNKRVLAKYKVDTSSGKSTEVPFPKSAAWLFKDDVSFNKDITKYNFDPDNKDLFLTECRSRILKPEVQKRIRELDASFDRTVAGIGVFYVLFFVAWVES